MTHPAEDQPKPPANHDRDAAHHDNPRKMGQRVVDWADNLVSKMAELRSVQWFLTVFSIISIIILVILFVRSLRSNQCADFKTTFDFLAYILPCFAAVSGGYGIYEKDIEKPLFGMSAVFLSCGLSFYLMANVATGVLVGTLFCALPIVPLVALALQAKDFPWNDRSLVKYGVWMAVGVLTVATIWQAYPVFLVATSIKATACE